MLSKVKWPLSVEVKQVHHKGTRDKRARTHTFDSATNMHLAIGTQVQ